MPKDYEVYLDDILDSIKKINKYTKSISYKEFAKNTLISDGVIRNLEVIGEAVKRLPLEMKRKYPDIEWRKIAGIRDILIHEYSGINLEIVWDVVVNKIPKLKISVKGIKKELR